VLKGVHNTFSSASWYPSMKKGVGKRSFPTSAY